MLVLCLLLGACEVTSGGRRPEKKEPAPKDSAPVEEPAPEPELLTDPIRVKVLEVKEAGILEVKMEGERKRVRLLGITPPRPRGRKDPAQYFGDEAKAWVEEQILGRHVKLRMLREKRKDKRGRLLAYVIAEDRDFNAKLVKRGLAWADGGGEHPRLDEYRRLEREARRERRGMWGREG
jgi:endonuclease YncB( thermonuclease family)